jgi:ketosteroid isomerase-like protein
MSRMHAHERLVRSALERLEAFDMEGYADCCTDDVVFTHPLGVARGREEFLQFHSAFHALSERYRRDERLLVSNNAVAVWITSGGTVAATGRSFEIQACTIFDIEDGKICAITEYADFGPVVAAFTPSA